MLTCNRGESTTQVQGAMCITWMEEKCFQRVSGYLTDQLLDDLLLPELSDVFFAEIQKLGENILGVLP